MIISNNIIANFSHRALKNTNNKAAKSMEKLSSGLRINRAGDDAAGLSISEKMRGQIRGLNQASRNIQDGVSLVQTAEGGMNEIHSLLQRGRELSVQAANGTNAQIDKSSIQLEIEQIINEIDNIANSTEFNTKKVLNNNTVDQTTAQSVIDGLKSGWLEESAKLIQNYYGLSPSTRDLTVVLKEGTAGGTLAYVRTTWGVSGSNANLSSLELHIELADFAPSSGDSGTNRYTESGILMYNDRIIAHEMVHAIMADSMGDDYYDMPTWFREGTAEFIHGADERLKLDVEAAGGIQNIVNRAAELINGAAWNGDSRDYSASYLAVKYIEKNLGSGKSFVDIISGINDNDSTTENTLPAIIANTTFADKEDLVSSLTLSGADFYNNTLNIDLGLTEADTGAIGGIDHGGSSDLSAEGVVPNGLTMENPTNFNIIFPSLSEQNGPLYIQLGPNSGHNMGINITSVTASALSINDIDVKIDAQAAITRFSDAINLVSSKRAVLGAVQNRLEYALSITNNTSENLQASESRIRDVDMAKEMMIFSKNNILSQAAQAMLLQANQQPQGVLQLLR